MRRLAALLVLAGCAASLPARLAKGDPAAEAEWEALSPARRHGILVEALRGGDGETRRIAALALDPRCLTLEEIRLQMAVLAERPDELWGVATAPALDWVSSHDLPVGSPDVPAIWRASLEVEPSDDLVMALSQFHRSALPSHIPDLVRLLPEADDDRFPILRWQLELLSSETDEHRDDVARGMLYGLARLRRQRKGLRPPEPPPFGREAFVTLAEATWGLAPDGGFGRQYIDAAEVWTEGPALWLHRRAKNIPLAAGDRPFLARVASGADPRQARVWAVRRLAELGDEATLRRVASGDGDVAFVAAAELARRGDRSRLDEMPAPSMTLLWWADRERAREEWLRRFREEEREAKEEARRGEVPWTQTGLFPDDPDDTEAEWGVRISAEDVAWIGEQLFALGAPPELIARYYVEVNPDGLTADAARRVLGGLQPGGLVEDFLGLCEVRDRAAVVALLDRWAGTEEGRDVALPLLARLGEGARVEEMIDAWDDWEWQEKWTLGRVKDPRVGEFLRGAPGGDEAATLDALATFHGLDDPGFSRCDEFTGVDWAEEPFKGARGLLASGKPVDAVLRLAEKDDLKEWAAATLAGVHDPEALAFLRRMREERWRGVYWVATAALATSGDEAAMAEWRAFLGEDRIWLVDGLQRWTTSRWSILTAGGDDALVKHWASRINTNCCLKFYAYATLSTLFPTVPLGNEGPGDWGQKGKVVRAWLDRHTFRKSEILGGLVPCE